MLRRATAGLVVLLALACAPSAFAVTFTVTTNADSGVGSLRQAILDANGSPGVDVIDFNLTFSNSTITPVTSLPPVSGEVTFDGSAGGQQPRIDGSAVHGVGLQFTIPSAAQSTVRGLTITGFTTGLDLGTASMLATGNYIGTDSIGTPGLGNGVGITFAQASQVGGTTAAERNVISNNGTGIVVTGSGGTIEGNYIGPDPSGENVFGGSGTGITVNGGSNVTIGGSGPGAGNVISGLSQNAIQLGTTTGDVIQGNVIGTTASQATVPGVDVAVELDSGANNNTIGGAGAAANVMAGAADVAIQVSGGTGNAIDHNFIGTDTGGTPFSTSNDEGVRIIGGSGNAFTNNRISSSSAQGIEIAGGPNTFTGNRIDANAGGGITVTAGGSTIGPGNTIVGNTGFGVQVSVGNGTTITQNSIDGTVGGLGIDLVGTANNSRAAPALTSAAFAGGGVDIKGTLTSGPSTIFTVEFFRSPSCNAALSGEGRTYIGSKPETTDSGGTVSFDESLSSAGSGLVVTATATDPSGNTSAFSNCTNLPSTGSLAGSVVLGTPTQTPPPSADVNLSAFGTEDWAIWGSGSNGTSTSLAPNTRKLGANEISSLTNIDPDPSVVLRGLGQFSGVEPFDFGWANGTGPMNASHVPGGLQHDGETQHLSTLNHGFGFDVPADTRTRTLRVYVATNRAAGTLTGTLSDGSAPPFVDVVPIAADVHSAVYTITYAAASANQTLHVDWVETADNCSPPHDIFYCDNAGIWAVALQAPNTYVVNTSDDHNDGVCDATDCTLREAIIAANAAAAPGVAGISFALPGGGPKTISLSVGSLPAVTVPVAIDGTTEPGVLAGTMGVTLNPGSITETDGLVLGPGSNGSTIRGLAVNGFGNNRQTAIRVDSDNNQIIGNYIGTTSEGTGAQPNYYGVVLQGDNNAVGGPNAGDRNVISGNSDAGVFVSGIGAPDGNVVAGNYIGLDVTGQQGDGNDGPGVWVLNAVHTVIGGSDPAAGNVMADNFQEVMLGSFTDPSTGTANVVQNNQLGLFADRSARVDGSNDGVEVMDAGSNTISDNLIAGEYQGIDICGSSNNTVVRNLIGSTTADPLGPDFGSANQGISILGGPCPFTAAASGNVIGGSSANGNTVLNSVLDNIAVDADSNTVSYNTVRGSLDHGIEIAGSQNTIGPANVVTDNGVSATGIAVDSGTGNTITQNSIDGNLGLGIDLKDDGITPNDAGSGGVDSDAGPNDLQNFPTIASAAADASSVTIQYDLQSVVSPTAYTVEFFASPNCDSSGNGEGATYIGSATPTLNGSSSSFTATFTNAAAVQSGEAITATATNPNGSTSEFSPCATAFDPGAAPLGTVSITAAAPTVEAGAPKVKLTDVPPSLFFDATAALGSSPVGSIPVGSIPVGSIPVNSIPVGSIPVSSIGLTATQSLLSSIALSTIPLTPPANWTTVLANTPLAGLPLQNVTLAQVLANSVAAGRLTSVPVGSINLSRSPLGSLTPAAIGLGSTPVGSIPVPPVTGEPSTDSNLQRWCRWLSGPPINCTSPTSLTATTTMVSTALQGAPVGSIPVGSIPVNSIPVNSIPVGSIKLGNIPVGSITVQRVNINYSPVGSIPVASIPVAFPVGSIPVGSIPVASINLAASPVGSIPVSSIPVGSITTIFSCIPTCPAGTVLLRDAALRSGLTFEQLLRAATAAFAARNITLADVIGFTDPGTLNGYTVADLIKSLPPNSGITYADLLALLLNPGDLSWETLDLTGTPIQNFATGGSTLGYQADFHLAPNGAPTGGATLDVTIPKGFTYKPGSTSLLINAVPVVTQPGDPNVQPDGTLRWTFALNVGTNYSLHFLARPGLTLGPTAATATIRPVGGVAAAAPAPAPVAVADTLEPNDTPGTAKPISTDANGSGDSFNLSYLTSKSDVDYYTFPIPPAGSRVTFHLSHLPADYDLVVYGPAGAGQLRPPVASTPPLDGQPLADTGFATTHATDPLAPQSLNDVVLAQGLPVYGVSTLRGTQDDAVAVVSNGEVGNYTVQVSGFNGATSDKPYMLRVETTPPPVLPACTPRTLGSASVAANLITQLPGQVASDVNTLFVVDDQQLSRIYSTTTPTGASVVTKLNSTANLTGYANAGFPAAVVHVDANPTVTSAYAAWNACPGDPAKANAVTKAIADVLDTQRATYKNVEYIVLVGGDDALPFWRLDDLTTLSTENGYAETFPSASALGGSLAAAKMLSDDPYGTTEPVPFFNGQLDVPDLVTGRLVETPANINAQLDAFIAGSTPGHLHPATALTTGYDFLSDGASAVSTALGAAATGTANKSAINDIWTKSTLVGAGALLFPSSGAAAPDIVSLNAHADHNHFKPAAGTDLFSATEAAAATQTLSGRLVFSMGCHAGLSVFDAFVPSNNLDWAQLFAQKGAAAYVANTGFGYGDSTTIAYSEDLNRRFAQGAVDGLTNPTGADLTVGEALTVAKQGYKGDLGIVGAYDEKAMAELTLYGLPMYRIGGSGVAPPPAGAGTAQAQTLQAHALTQAAPLSVPASSFPSDPSTGLNVEPFNADRTFGAAVSTPRGSYYTGTDGLLVEHFRPIEPKAIEPITIDKAHGALLTELSSQDVTGFDPVYARPIVDSAGVEPEVGFDDLAFPSKLQSVTTFKRLRATKQQVVLAQGQFFSASPTDGLAGGTQRLFTHEQGIVFSSPSDDYAPPVFSTLQAQVLTGGQAAFVVGVTDRDGVSAGVVKRVVVAYKDLAGGNAWHFVDLAQSATTPSSWSGIAPLSGTHLQYFVQAVDANGNVAVSTNKGLYYQETPPPTASGGVDVVTAGTPAQNGWFNGSASVVVTVNGVAPAPGTATLSIDGGAPVPYTGAVPVTGDGPHTATAETATGSDSTFFLVDNGPPMITVGAPAANTAFEQTATNSPSSFSCTDAGIGVASCTGPSTFDTTTPGFHSFTVNATDLFGHTSMQTFTYAVISITSPAQGANFARGDAAASSFTCGALAAGTTCNATVTRLTAPAGPLGGNTSGQALPTSVAGTYTFAVTLADSAGHTATLTHTFTVGIASISGKLVFTRQNRIWTINPDGSGLTQLTGPSSGAGFDDQAAKSPDGTKVVFVRRASAAAPGHLWVIDADGQNAQALTSGSASYDAPAWSPDGQRIAFQSNRAGSIGTANDIWVGTWNPTLSTPLVGLVDLTNNAADDVTPAWSPTSVGKLAFASDRGKSYDIYTMSPTGTSVLALTSDKATDREPTWSPDGAKITFSSNRATSGTANGFEIYVMGAPNGNSQNRLTTIAGDDKTPFWLDANRIVFASAQVGPAPLGALAIVAPTGGASTKIASTTAADLNPG